MKRNALVGFLCVIIAALAVTTFELGTREEVKHEQNQIYWSGYNWQVRPPGVGLPGPNRWTSTEDTVKVNDDGSLQMSIVNKDGKWYSGEISNTKALGYGIYRWTIATDLSKIDPRAVLGMFTYDTMKLSTHREIDIEATRWGGANNNSGWTAYWLPGNKELRRAFSFSDKPPYQAQFQWQPGQISYYVSDRTGKALIDLSFTELIPDSGEEVATVNFWRFRNQPPIKDQSVRITKFTWEPLSTEDNDSDSNPQ
jgi:hypothetical protein